MVDGGDGIGARLVVGDRDGRKGREEGKGRGKGRGGKG